MLALLELALAVVTFLSLRFVTAPYGRHERAGWGPTIPARLGWLVMESPAPLLFLVLFHRASPFLALWELHYLYRAFVYPFLLRGSRRMPALVAALAIAFNVLNAFVNAPAAAAARMGPHVLVGAALFLGGFALNVTSDRTLRNLRAPGETGYRIPRGGAFRWVSCPNYLGEMIEWTGWAIATWSLGGLAFAIYTAANLAPRALSHHAWYRAKFPDYPRERRALIPFVV